MGRSDQAVAGSYGRADAAVDGRKTLDHEGRELCERREKEPSLNRPDEARMRLRLLDLPLLLKPSDPDLFRDFFVPALTYAFRYDRGVGYCASGWLRRAAHGMARLDSQAHL